MMQHMTGASKADPRVDASCIFDSGAVEALASALEVSSQASLPLVRGFSYRGLCGRRCCQQRKCIYSGFTNAALCNLAPSAKMSCKTQREQDGTPETHCTVQAAAAGRCWNVRRCLDDVANSTVGRIHMASSCLPPGLFHVADALVLVSRQVGRFAPTLCTIAPTGMAASAHHARSHNVQR